MASGPGKSIQKDKAFKNCRSVSQPFSSTTKRCINEICAAGPPKDKRPIFAHRAVASVIDGVFMMTPPPMPPLKPHKKPRANHGLHSYRLSPIERAHHKAAFLRPIAANLPYTCATAPRKKPNSPIPFREQTSPNPEHGSLARFWLEQLNILKRNGGERGIRTPEGR